MHTWAIENQKGGVGKTTSGELQPPRDGQSQPWLRGVVAAEHRWVLYLPARAPVDASRIVITEADKQVVGMPVDGVAKVVDVAASAIESAPKVGNDDGARYIQGVLGTERPLLMLVDLNALLGRSEWGDVGGS